MMSTGKGEEGWMWSSCAVKQLQFYHRLTGSVGRWRCREQGDERQEIACIPVTFHSHTLYQVCVWGGGVNRSGNIAISFFVLERLRYQ